MRSISAGFAGQTRFTLLSGAGLAAMCAPAVAMAQDAPVPVNVLSADDIDDTPTIIVTASKREQTLQETPISVSVTSGETLENAQIRDVLDLQTVTPSLRVSQLQTASASTFIIRGFGNGDNNFGIEPSVGVFIDGVFRSRSAGALSDLPNVQRIEVLNGPQSTLFGKNASAGVISVVTREPQFDFGGSVEASYGNYNAIIVKGDVTGPIGENVAFSLDASYNSRDGFGEIVNLGEDINDRNRWSARGQLLIEPSPDLRIRAIADYSKIDEVCCTVGNVVNGPTGAGIVAVGGQLPTDFFSREVFLNFVPTNEVDNYGGSIQVDWETGPISVTSITAYRELQNSFLTDIDFTSADIATETRAQDVQTFTQELRITSDFDGPLNFLLGAFYFDESITQDSAIQNGSQIRNFFEILAGEDPVAVLTNQPTLFNALEAPVALGGFGFGQETIFNTPLLTQEAFFMDNQAWSIFGTVDFEPIDGLVLTGGFNYTDDEKNFGVTQTSFDPLAQVNFVDAFITAATMGGVTTRDQFQALPAVNQAALLAAATDPAQNPLLGLAAFQFQPPFLNFPNSVEPGVTNDDKLTYLFRVAYEISPEVNVYASYATGFKASSVNLSRDSRPANTDFLAGPGGSTFAAPDSNIINAGLQVPNLVSGSRFAGPEEAEVYEVGIKAAWDGISINLAVFDQTITGFQSFAFTGTGFALRNAGQQSVQGFELDTTIIPTDGLVLTFAATHLDPLFDSFPGSVLGDLTGVTPAGIPEWAIATSATYTHEFDSGTQIVSRIDYNHESSTLINNGLPTFGPNNFTREVNLVNASVTLKLNNGLEVGAWARNLLDDEFITTVFDGVAQAGTVSGYPNAPRTYGGLVRFRF
jgi:outer membrane receptor protein involved in Fe transport